MPIYEYACDKCAHEWEVEQRITDAPVKTCPKCRSRKVKKLISQTSFVLKGGGWYSDLYASKKGGDAKGKDAKEGAGDADKGEKKSDAAAKPDASPSGGGKGKSKEKAQGKSKAAA